MQRPLRGSEGVRGDLTHSIGSAPRESIHEWLGTRLRGFGLPFSGAKESHERGQNFPDLLTIGPLDGFGVQC